MSQIPGRLITYCTNIHPGETWDETFAALQKHVPVIKRAVSPDKAFPIGLRLSHRAVTELSAGKNKEFISWLDGQDCFVPTINGFPFGSFHNSRIKEQVYLPDWRMSERASYTIQLANLLADWLPADVTGSISTVPIVYGKALGVEAASEINKRLESVLTCLARLHDEQGKMIMLALEPEPGCLLETTEEVCRFFKDMDLPLHLRKHVGICYDCCHQAVEFEDPAESLMRLAKAGVPIAKVQVSSALKIEGEHAHLLQRFDEPCYLHQVVVRRRDGLLARYPDLSDASAKHFHLDGDEWRCHFHVPIFVSGSGNIGTTQDFLVRILPLIGKEILLEAETYTWEILPDSLRSDSVSDSVIREISWLEAQLHA
jgi:hypothetical protein